MSFTESLDEVVAADENGLLGIAPTWNRIQLSEVAQILNGFPFPSDRFSREAGTPLIRIRDVVTGTTDTRFDGGFDATFLVKSGDLLVGMDGDFNTGLWRGSAALLNQRVCKITPDDNKYSLRFLRHVLPGYLEAINRRTHAVTVKHLSSRTIAAIPVPYPPRETQERLANVLDSYLSRIEVTAASLERVQRNLQRYRASVLKAAVEGRLVPTEAELARDQERNFEPAKQLLERALVARRARWEKSKANTRYVEPATPYASHLPDLPEGWCWASLDALTEIVGGITKNQKRTVTAPAREVPYLRVANVQRGYLDLSTIATIIATELEIEELRLAPNDILFNEGGDRDKLGRGWIWSGEIRECIHQNHVFRARPILSELSARYISWYGNSAAQAFFIRSGTQTTNLASLSKTQLRVLPVPLPPAAEQSRIAAEVSRQFTIADAIETSIANDLARLRGVRTGVLRAAFSDDLA